MEFTEMEKRMLYQTEGCERYAALNELSIHITSNADYCGISPLSFIYFYKFLNFF